MKYILLICALAILTGCTLSYKQTADGAIDLNTIFVPVEDWKK
jgi:Skp family chaperone for outer membrane proteins